MHRFAVELAFDRLSKAKLPTAIASDQRFRLNIGYKQLYLVENFLPLHMTRGRVLIRAVVHRSKLESLAGQLIERLAQGSAMESVISSAAAVLQSADEMKMAELNDPALACAEFDNTRNLVGDRGTDTSVYRGRNSCEGVRPPLHVLSAFAQHRIEEDRSILMTRLYRHQIHNPIFAAKAKVQSVQDQNQGTFGQAQIPRSRCELSQSSTKPPTQPLPNAIVELSEHRSERRAIGKL